MIEFYGYLVWAKIRSGVMSKIRGKNIRPEIFLLSQFFGRVFIFMKEFTR